MLAEPLGRTTLHLIPLIPRIKLVEGVKHGLANFDERRAETHRTPISKGPNRNTAPVAFSHFVGCQEFASFQYRLLWQRDSPPCRRVLFDHRGGLSSSLRAMGQTPGPGASRFRTDIHAVKFTRVKDVKGECRRNGYYRGHIGGGDCAALH